MGETNSVETGIGGAENEVDPAKENTISNLLSKPALSRVRSASVASYLTENFGSIVLTTHDKNDDDINDVTTPVTKAPDGGWGWVIVVAVFFTFFIQGFIFSGHSVLYVTLVEYFQADRGVAAWIGSLYSFTGNILGLVIGVFIKQYGSRFMGIAGSIIGAVGLALSYLLINIPYLCVTVGVISGIGSTLNIIASIVILQQYFDKKRALATGIATAGTSMGAFLSPPVLNAFINKYGLSGTYLLEAGIWLQLAIFASLYRPLHKLKSTKNEGKQSLQIVTIIKDSFDFSVLRNPQLVMFLVGTVLFNYGIMSFYGHYLSRMAYLGTERRLAIIFQSVMASSTLVIRFIFSFIGNIKGLDRPLLYATAVTIGGIMIITFPVAKTPPALCAYGIVNGMAAGVYFCVQPATMVDVAGVSEIAKITGLFHTGIGIAILTTIPLTGYIMDISGSYDLPFIVVGVIHLCGAGVLMALAILRRTRWKTKESK